MIKLSSHIVISLILFLPAISLISGFAATPIILLACTALLYQNFRKKIYTKNIQFFVLEMLFILWCCCSILWSIEPLHTAKYALSLLFLLIIFVVTLNDVVKYDKIEKILLYGIILSFGVFTIEYLSEGIIYSSLRSFLAKPAENYLLSSMDRGCALISCISWVVISWLLQTNHSKTAMLFVIALIIMLALSDSLAALVGFILGIITFSLIYLTRFKILNFIILGLLAYSIIMPSFFASNGPWDIVNKYDFLPLSAKHRVFIWNFTAEKFSDQPLIGHGLNNSKLISSTVPNNYIMFEGIKFELLPLHPHNNIIQLLLELGVIGLMLYLAAIIKNLLKVRDLALQNQNIIWGAAAVACFVNYFFVGMVAYNLWQSWWIISSIGLTIIFRISLANSQHKIITH